MRLKEKQNLIGGDIGRRTSLLNGDKCVMMCSADHCADKMFRENQLEWLLAGMCSGFHVTANVIVGGPHCRVRAWKYGLFFLLIIVQCALSSIRSVQYLQHFPILGCNQNNARICKHGKHIINRPAVHRRNGHFTF